MYRGAFQPTLGQFESEYAALITLNNDLAAQQPLPPIHQDYV